MARKILLAAALVSLIVLALSRQVALKKDQQKIEASEFVQNFTVRKQHQCRLYLYFRGPKLLAFGAY